MTFLLQVIHLNNMCFEAPRAIAAAQLQAMWASLATLRNLAICRAKLLELTGDIMLEHISLLTNIR